MQEKLSINGFVLEIIFIQFLLKPLSGIENLSQPDKVIDTDLFSSARLVP